MKILKTSLLIALCLMAGSTVFAAGQQESDATNLTLMLNFQSTEAVTAAFEEVIEDFHSANPTIKIDLISGTSDYEALMKSKMATNDLPDMWSTHGWSVLRYSEYLMPLEDQEWVSRLHPAIKPVVTDDQGHIYVLPVDVDMAGVAYNKTILADAGVNVEDLKTWNDLYAAMDKVKAIGVTPVHIGGKDSWTVGNFFDWAAPALYVTDPNNYSGDELVNGSFDTEKWEILAGLMKEMNEKGYLNVDNLTSTYSDSARALAVGDAAFTFLGNYVLAEAWTFDPNADLGFFPVPAFYKGDSPSLISGERSTVGIWKDSPNAEACKTFLDFLAIAENAAKIAGSNGIPAGLIDAESDTGKLKADYIKWADAPAFPYFDRAFLPSGMWDTMCSTGAGILSGDMSTADAAAKMKEDFTRMYK
jgi:raffinose/stachyose/melibiose transport system substrate-binding protein